MRGQICFPLVRAPSSASQLSSIPFLSTGSSPHGCGGSRTRFLWVPLGAQWLARVESWASAAECRKMLCVWEGNTTSGTFETALLLILTIAGRKSLNTLTGTVLCNDSLLSYNLIAEMDQILSMAQIQSTELLSPDLPGFMSFPLASIFFFFKSPMNRSLHLL